MHLHPTVGRLLIDIGREHGLRAIRVPAEPPGVLARLRRTGRASARARCTPGARVLRRQARRAGLLTNDHAFGIAWSGHMTASGCCALRRHLPEGVSEIYFHPAVRRDPMLVELMPEYEHEAELAALLDSRVPATLAASGASMTDFSQEVGRCPRSSGSSNITT